jgi:predicted aspartyl protease
VTRLLTIAVLAVVVSTCPAYLSAQTSSDIDTANKLFKAGNFESADKIYTNLAGKNPKNEEVLRQLGYIALLRNQLGTAQKWLEKALALKADDASARVMLATVYYRRDDLPKAGDILKQLGPNEQGAAADFKMLTVPKLESFRGLTAYQLRGPGQRTTVKFVTDKLLPVVTVRINGAPEATFFIDTGGAELVLDTEYAKELGVKSMGSFQGTFSGGQKAEVLTSKVDSLALGDWTVSNVPVVMMALRQLSEAFGVKRLDGCVGTNVLYHFLATMDYPHQQLVLRRKDSESLKQLNQSAAGNFVRVPMYLAGDHYIVALGQVNNVPPAMLFVDTGLAGAGVKLGETMLKNADIKLEEDKAESGAGGGGTLKIVPYTVNRVSLGEIKEQNVGGLYDGPFPWENSFGFYLAGMVGDHFVKPYAVTFDFSHMQMLFQK